MNNIPKIAQFPTETRWSLVARARNAADPEAERALNEICERYWYPIYAFARRSGISAPDAEDGTQSFFAKIGEHIGKVDSNKGKLRTFFVQIVKRQLINEWKKANRQKRGGGCVVESLDADAAERRYSAEPENPDATPEEFYEYLWAKEIFLYSLDAVGAEWAGRGKAEMFKELKPLILSPVIELDPSVTRESAREVLGITNDNLKYHIKKIRDRLKALVAAEVNGTLTDPASADGQVAEEVVAEEVAHIFSTIAMTGSGIGDSHARS